MRQRLVSNDSSSHEILIVDDEEMIAEILQNILTAMGFQVVGLALSGEEGIEMARRLSPDLILMDIVMPGRLDGIDSAEVIRRELGIPVIFVTAYADTEVVQRARKAAPVGYIVKPFKDLELRATVRTGLQIAALEKQLRESEEALKKAQHLARVGSWRWHRADDTLVLSDEMRRIYGLADESDGQSATHGYPDSHPPVTYKTLIKMVHPDDREAIKEAVEGVISGALPDTQTYRIVRPDEQVRWLISTAPEVQGYLDDGTPSALVGTVQDITESKRLADETQLLYDISRGLFLAGDVDELLTIVAQPATNAGACCAALLYLDVDDNGRPEWAEVVAITSADGMVKPAIGARIHLAESSFTRLWTENPNEPQLVADLSLDSRLDERTREDLTDGVGQALAVIPLSHSGRWVGLVTFVWTEPHHFSEQEIRVFRALISMVSPAVESRRLVRDLRAERALLAQRVEERTAELSQANAELARAVRTKDEFMASMSHELRTPLNSVLGLSEALLEESVGALNQRQKRSLETISSSGRHLLSLINDILDLSKIEAGALDIELKPVAIADICQASLQLVKQAAQHKRINLSCNPGDSLVTIDADGRRLKQILVNLLANAVKFTPEGGSVGLDVVADRERAALDLSIWDTGVGISEEDSTQLFKPFVQVDSSLARRYEGTGLGLALVARLTEAHGGSVTVESQIGEGSRFTVSLPGLHQNYRGGEPASERDPGDAPALVPDADLKGATILIAEDNEPNIEMLSSYLADRGFRVVTARDGDEAVERARQEQPALIIMDIQMPEVDGMTATRKIRSDRGLAETPIIALTALAMPGDRERCLAAGINEYMSKPVNLKQLLKTIRKLVTSPPSC
jgi:signal transduction histidine kinase/DNA-binding response OmpR family regulator